MGKRHARESAAFERAALARAAGALAATFMAVFLLAAGLKLYGPIGDDAPPAFRMGGIVGLGSFALCAATSAIRGRPFGRVAALWVLFLCLCVGVGGTLVANAWLDTGPERRRIVRLLAKNTTTIGRRRKQQIVVASWRTPNATIRLTEGPTLSDIFIDGLRVDAELVLITMPGRFGFEWLRAARTAP